MSALPPPEIRLKEVLHETPFEHFVCDKMGPGREYFDTLVVKGTFAIAQRARAEVAREQLPIALADELWNPDDAERSAVRQAGEVVLTKPTTDVMLSGHAYAPDGEATTDWWTEVGVRGRDFELAQGAHVLGPNRWRFAGRHGWVLERPEAVTQVPIRYDLAFGGAYRTQRTHEDAEEAGPEWVTWAQNPSGLGFLDEDGLDDECQYAAPQWLPDESCVGRTRDVGLAGYGPVARPWPTRLKYAGTYDEEWLEKARKSIERGIPADYARDFDPRFFQCAHPGLIMPRHLVGNEVIRLVGLMPGAEAFEFQLPCLALSARLTDHAGKEEVRALPLDTVQIDTDSATVSLCWRLSISQRREVVRADLQAQGTP